MPTFDTPEPISVSMDLVVGNAHVTASDRRDTVVEVRPSDASRDMDVRVAEQTHVEYVAGRLVVKTPRPRALGLIGKVGSVDVSVELPEGSHVQADASVGTFVGVGRLGECRIKTAAGNVHLDDTGALDVNTSAGTVDVGHVVGHAEVKTGSGRARVRSVEGTAVVKSANGDVWVGQTSGDLRVNTANGAITVDHADAGVTANTANGEIRIGDIRRGSATLKSSMGEIEVGIRAGTAARLDLHTSFGNVHNHMDSVERPEPSDHTVDVRARTSYGDIVIRRSSASFADQSEQENR